MCDRQTAGPDVQIRGCSMGAKTKKHSFKPRFFIILLVLVVGIGVLLFTLFRGPETFGPPEKGHILYTASHSPASQVEQIDVKLLSKYAEVYDITNGRVLYEKNADKKARPASLTKVMTAILAIENIEDLNKKISTPASVYKKLRNSDLARLELKGGEKLTGNELLYGLLLPSAADCACTLAIESAGSEKAFVKMMNEKAKELKMDNTSFGNPIGEDDDRTYTTADDYVKLLRYALKNETFRKFFTTKKYMLGPSNKRDYSIALRNLTFGKFPGGASYIKGGKTGTTDGAGHCLATLGELNANEYVSVTMYAEPTSKHPLPTGEDAKKIYSQIEKETNKIIKEEYE